MVERADRTKQQIIFLFLQPDSTGRCRKIFAISQCSCSLCYGAYQLRADVFPMMLGGTRIETEGCKTFSS